MLKNPKFGGKIYQFGGKSRRKKINSAEFMELVFSMSGCNNSIFIKKKIVIRRLTSRL